jgi:acyl-CoA synthetase (NDP forming)
VALLEPEGYELLGAMGIETPAFVFVPGADALSSAELSAVPGDEVVVKLVSPDILHKSDAGGVVFVGKDLTQVKQAIASMEKAFKGKDLRGHLVAERVEYDPSLGGELLFGVRWTDDFGAVLSYGAGGLYTEYLAENFKTGRDIAIASASSLNPTQAEELIRGTAVTHLITGELRGQAERIPMHALVDVFLKFAELAHEAMPEGLSELEVNPLIVADGRLVALDVLATCSAATAEVPAKRPLHKIGNLLEPKSMAFVGVSERMNPGRVSLINTLRAGFDPNRMHIVKPGSDSIDECACYPDLDSLPEKVDHLVLAVAASQIPGMLATVVKNELAESMLLIPGGLGEKEGSEEIVATIEETLTAARATEWGGPVLVGANSMGIRSEPGRYDTTFLPDSKLPMSSAPPAPIAFISQSGAFYGAKSGKLGLSPRYAISVGNQTDLTLGDYLTYLKDDSDIETFAVYAEGFRPLDGPRFLAAAAEITAQGRTVILYRAGRTPEGAKASAGHTASIAGDYAVCRELATQAGVIVCETTADFEDMVKLAVLLESRPVKGLRLGAISNAGFECVSMADHAADLQLATLSDDTVAGLRLLLEESRLDGVVDVRNPVDLTPIMPDDPFERAVRLVLEDDNVDVGLVGCVPLTGALQTLDPGDDHSEDIYSDDSVAMRLIRLKQQVKVPWVVAVDGGPLYDPMARLLEANGIPAFRTADRALRLLSRYCSAKLGQ